MAQGCGQADDGPGGKTGLAPGLVFYCGPSGEGDPVELLKGRIFPISSSW
jgi:hypothetical protein